MKLYEVPKNTWINVELANKTFERLFFDHLDGAYSVCIDESGNTVHLAGWVEVTVAGDNSLD